MKKLSFVLFLILALAMAVPAFAQPQIGGDLRVRLNGYYQGAPADFEGRLRLFVTGNATDWLGYNVILTTNDIDFEDFSGTSLVEGRAFLTVTPQDVPVTVELGDLDFGSGSPLAIYSDSFDLGGSMGVRVIGPSLAPGLSGWAMFSPDVTADGNGGKAEKNDKAFAVGLSQTGNFGKVSGAVWKRDDFPNDYGWTVSGSFNVAKDDVVLYGLIGQNPDPTKTPSNNYKAVGVYLPFVSELVGVYPYMEYDVQNECFGVYLKKVIDGKVTLEFTAKQAIIDNVTKDKELVFTPAITVAF